MSKLHTQYQNSVNDLAGKQKSFLGPHSVHHFDDEHKEALPLEYQNSLFQIAGKPMSFLSGSHFFSHGHWHDFMLKVSAYLDTIGDMGKKEIEETSGFIRHDVEELRKDYQHSAEDFKHSAWYQALDNVAWNALASITDKSQVEWTEIGEDIQHQGRYFVGDEVGFGVLRCVRCGYQKELFHPAKVLSCANCEGEEFVREGFQP